MFETNWSEMPSKATRCIFANLLHFQIWLFFIPTHITPNFAHGHHHHFMFAPIWKWQNNTRKSTLVTTAARAANLPIIEKLFSIQEGGANQAKKKM